MNGMQKEFLGLRYLFKMLSVIKFHSYFMLEYLTFHMTYEGVCLFFVANHCVSIWFSNMRDLLFISDMPFLILLT